LAWDISQAWSDELGDVRQDLYVRMGAIDELFIIAPIRKHRYKT
jgi:hypothetical protein